MYPVWFQNWVRYPVFWVHPRFLNSNISNVCNRKVGFLAPYPKNWVHFPKLGTNWVHDFTQNVTVSLPFVNLLLTFGHPLHEQMPLRRTSSSQQLPPSLASRSVLSRSNSSTTNLDTRYSTDQLYPLIAP